LKLELVVEVYRFQFSSSLSLLLFLPFFERTTHPITGNIEGNVTNELVVF